MSLETPIKIRMLQRKLYQKAKEEPNYRFYLLYDKIYRTDILEHAYALVRANGGTPGVDEVRFETIEAAGLEASRFGSAGSKRSNEMRTTGATAVFRPSMDASLSRFFARGEREETTD